MAPAAGDADTATSARPGTGSGGDAAAPASGRGGSGGAGSGGSGSDPAAPLARGGGAAAGAGSETRPLACTVAIDVRGLGAFQRDMTSIVYAGGQQLWPDAALIKGVSSELVQAGNLHTYVTAESQLAAFPNVTRVKAERIQPNRFAPNSQVYTDVTLSGAAAAQFRSAGSACRVVYLKD